jgi:tetratricopeptide (TPR) repeat protein
MFNSARRRLNAPSAEAALPQRPMDFALAWIGRQLAFGDVSATPCQTHPELDRLDGLGLQPLAMAAAVLGDAIDANILARMLEMDVRRLVPLLAVLVAEGVLRARGRLDQDGFEFADPQLLSVAYGRIAPGVLAVLHRRVADSLSADLLVPPLDHAVRIAGHYEAAAAWTPAFSWWCTAAERAIVDTQIVVAVAHLQHALALGRQQRGVISPQAELGALSLLGPLLAQLKGSGAVEVADVYARSLEIAKAFEDVDRTATFDALWGLSACILVHGRIDTAREIGELLLRSAEVAGDPTQILLATRLKGLGNLLAGEIGPAIGNFSAVERLYDVHRHAPLRFRYASDQVAVALAHKAWAEAIAGQAQVSERTSTAALDHAQRLRHPHTSAHVVCVLAACAQTLRQRNRAAPLATAGLALARRHGFPYWEAWAQFILGWHVGGYDPNAGAARIEAAIAAYRRTGAGQALPYAQLLRAKIALAAGDYAIALQATDVALDLSATHCIGLFEAEILRTKAQALVGQRARQGLLEAAIAIARRQGACLFEARATQALGHAAI